MAIVVLGSCIQVMALVPLWSSVFSGKQANSNSSRGHLLPLKPQNVKCLGKVVLKSTKHDVVMTWTNLTLKHAQTQKHHRDNNNFLMIKTVKL